MDRKKYQELTRRPIHAPSVKLTDVIHLDRRFQLEVFPGISVGESGLLEVAKLTSVEAIFRMRWDEHAGTVDIDLLENGSTKRRVDFTGHHTTQISDAPNREYLIDIIYGGKRVFKGTLELSIATANRLEVGMRYMIKG